MTFRNAIGAEVAALVNDEGALIVAGQVNRGAMTDRSGTITTGGTAQQAAASNATRKGLMVQNISDTTDLWCRTDGTAAAAAGSIRIQPGQMLTFDAAMVGTGAVSMFSTLTGHAYTAKEM